MTSNSDLTSKQLFVRFHIFVTSSKKYFLYTLIIYTVKYLELTNHDSLLKPMIIFKAF